MEVGDFVGEKNGLFDGFFVGAAEGLCDNVGSDVGDRVGLKEIVGFKLGDCERVVDGKKDDGNVGVKVGLSSVGCCIGVRK